MSHRPQKGLIERSVCDDGDEDDDVDIAKKSLLHKYGGIRWRVAVRAIVGSERLRKGTWAIGDASGTDAASTS